jgi:hypothetical protein
MGTIVTSGIEKYNNTKHSTIGITPVEARQPKNELHTSLNIRMKSQFNLRYPKLEIGDSVRTRIKKHTFKKGWVSTWSDIVYKVLHITDGSYLLNDANRRRLWIRHDLLRVSGVEDKNG